ncbi:HipA domain-containing protein [Mesorhizobium sp.]|uniref:HipA domain-containing protein n=1 Tax=Mesorhizobium sp. TaxID=1871066 RepID=UPI000FE736F7|nr:HipA domain-containing protein [Mesorhizobium sp.]RWI16654.1 MAG: type II toxin-antitoxin system HipA family toxin [Mesorhizobium sp.]RWN07723.1 MAG: type II toxin-antitoxin system HipA family toxin [Mesorhizobium sp.]RWN12360.1 MAG: type II toxin-antitoxin system HipA family toxin [Mesorhizobium sp.]TIQ97769.1 MAG: type II toxin-antitoxin system HipA family toxin [Mesorhizobium sp.]
MELLALDVRLDGFADPIGALVRDENGSVAFVYKSDYLRKPDATALSLSLPLTEKPYDDVITRAFFDNLLQERDGVLTEVMAREGLARDDIAGLLYHLGKDCAGALSVLPSGSPPTKVPGDYEQDYVPIAPDRLIAIVEALHQRKRLPDGTEDPSPLAGIQSKIAVTVLPDGSFAEPRHGSGAPTTHILKVPDRDHQQDARYEAEAMRLSRKLGFDTAEASLVPIGGIDALLVTRFDRGRDRQNRIVRLHQEDFAQALGLPASLKYERRGKAGRRFDVSAVRGILEATADPAEAKEIFIRATVFDLLVGNNDGHAKNFALLYERGGRIHFAPRYDILPTRLDATLTDELAYRIGEAETLDEVTSEEFDAFLLALGIQSAAARKRMLERYPSQIASDLADCLGALEERQVKRFADLIATNMRALLSALRLEIPAAARDRDEFIGRAGGWLMS